MPRKPDICFAFTRAVQKNPKGYLYLRTADFIREPGKLNWHFCQADANEWIKRYQPAFIDKTPDFSKNWLWMMRNMWEDSLIGFPSPAQDYIGDRLSLDK